MHEEGLEPSSLAAPEPKSRGAGRGRSRSDESQRFSAPALDQRRPVATSPALSEAHPAVSPAPPPDDLLVRLGADFAAALARGDMTGAKALCAAINQLLDAEDPARRCHRYGRSDPAPALALKNTRSKGTTPRARRRYADMGSVLRQSRTEETSLGLTIPNQPLPRARGGRRPAARTGTGSSSRHVGEEPDMPRAL